MQNAYDATSRQALLFCGQQGRELQYEVFACGSVRFLAAFGSSAKLCPEHSYAPAKGTSFENGGIKGVTIRLRFSGLSSLRDSVYKFAGLRVARGRLA